MTLNEVRLGAIYETFGKKLVRALRKRRRNGTIYVGTVADQLDGTYGWATDTAFDWYPAHMLTVAAQSPPRAKVAGCATQ